MSLDPIDVAENISAERTQRAEQILSSVSQIPSAPPVAFKLLSLMKKSNQHISELSDIIRYDANLTARLLKISNSTFYNPSGNNTITSVEEAIQRLGFATVSQTVLALSFGNIYKQKHELYQNPYELWKESLCTAHVASYLSGVGSNYEVKKDMVFTAGMLSNVGKVVLNLSGIEEIDQIKPLAESCGISNLDAEREVLRTDYAEIGGLLLQDWGIPQEIVEAVRYHVSPEKSPLPLTSLCFVASGLMQEVEWENENLEVLERLGIKEEELQTAMEKAEKQVQGIQSSMMVA